MSFFSKNWKIREIFFPRKLTPLKLGHSPILKKTINKERKKEKKKEERKRERKKVHLNFKLNNYDSNE